MVFHNRSLLAARPQFVSPGSLGAVSYWPIDEGSGTTVVDVIGGRNGTLSNASAWSSGRADFNQLYYVSAADAAAWDITPNLTCFCWVAAAQPTVEGWIGGRWNGAANARSWQWATLTGANTMRVNVGDDGTFNAGHIKSYVGSQTVLDDTFHSAAFRFAAGTLDLFVDGVKDPSPSKNIDDAITTIFTSAEPLGIGGSVSGTPTAFLNGIVSKFSIYNTALTDANIAALHTLGS